MATLLVRHSVQVTEKMKEDRRLAESDVPGFMMMIDICRHDTNTHGPLFIWAMQCPVHLRPDVRNLKTVKIKMQ
eukprot:4069536-Amphidinium_carterae.1